MTGSDSGTDADAERADGQTPDSAVEPRRFFFGLHSKAAGWWFLLAVILAVVAANALLAHWSAPDRPREVGSQSGSAAPAQPDPLQATSIAQREFGQLSGGGWAQAWQLWSDSARGTLTQADFVRLNTECRPALGVPYVIDSTTTIDATTVAVAWHQAATAGSSTVVYENGAWHFVPDAQTLAAYHQGVDRLISDRKAAGQCH
ncbi:hypothetical protein GCM10009839_48280 [Catenulispora yoronensis]|uniref:Lipoprotein n=1 Tax=Catenulispora yoronensis TaxID=450799 RepID=A0ABP5G9N1_9ACTN